MVLLLATNQLDAQSRSVEDFQKSRFAPPVHIPPRVPLYDPGLPDSLNGKFNSTQQIRSAQPFQGQRAVIGDVRQDNSKLGPQRPANGLQRRLSQLITPNKDRGGNPPPKSAAPRSKLQKRLQKSVNSAVQTHQHPQRVVSAPASPFRSPTPSKRVASNQIPNRAIETNRNAHGNAAHSIHSRPVNIPARVAANTGPMIRRTGMQEQVLGLDEELAQIDHGKPEAVTAWNEPNQFNSNSFVADAQQGSLSREMPNGTSNHEGQPISVMTQPENGLSLEPEPLPNHFESNSQFNHSNNHSPAENTLREYSVREPVVASPVSNSRAYRNQDDADSDTDPDLDESEDRRAAVPQKTCAEFRQQLLNRPITEIPLDISPPARTDILGMNSYRVWRDRNGNELAQGSIADIRRGYVIINASNGGQVRLPYARLSEVDWKAISDYWILPEECGLGNSVFAGRNWIPQTVNWHASSLCHKPLYFENIQLERYGHSAGPILQPILSTGHFFERTFFFPYNTAINPPNECQYALGFYRPGDCAPWLKAPFPISLSGATRQAIWFTGFGFLTQ